MSASKNVLTTGEVARICNVAPRTVSKWFDSGQLRGYRIPGSKDRRIPLDHLVRFMRAHGIPLNGLDGNQKRVLVLEGDAGLGETIRTALASNRGYEVATAASAFEAGALAAELKPQVLVVDVSLPDVSPPVLVRWLRGSASLQDTGLIGVAGSLTEGQGQALLQQGFDAYLCKPFEIRELIQLIENTSSRTVAEAIS